MTLWTDPVTFASTWERAVVRAPADTFLVFEGPDNAVPELAGHIRRTNRRIGFCATARADVYRCAVEGVAASGMTIVEIEEADTELAVFAKVDNTTWPTPTLRQRAAVMFTSGTTGQPKGVEITQANYAFAGATMADVAGLGAAHRQLVVLPLFHANAQFYSFASAISAGASVALIHTFSASGFVAQAAHHRATHASLFAAPIRMILSRGATPHDGLALEVAVVGRPDEIRDEVPVAFVVANDPESPPDIAALHPWCAERLTKSKRPRDITLVEQLPRTSVGKIRKFLLRDPKGIPA